MCDQLLLHPEKYGIYRFTHLRLHYTESMSSQSDHSPFPFTNSELHHLLTEATLQYWNVRNAQAARQGETGDRDRGSRGEVTGGGHLTGFMQIIREIIIKSGFSTDEIHTGSRLDLPGYFRPTKKWDIIVTRNHRLCAVIEMKSQTGPSFGNNFNNRAEEAIGSSVDFWTAFREGAFGSNRPWLGYFFLLEDHPSSRRPINLFSPLFEPFPLFHQTSYADRYAILCRHLLQERHYDASTLILTPRDGGGKYSEPYEDLQFASWAKRLYGHLIGCQ